MLDLIWFKQYLFKKIHDYCGYFHLHVLHRAMRNGKQGDKYMYQAAFEPAIFCNARSRLGPLDQSNR